MMIECSKLGEIQKEIIDRVLEFIKLYAPYKPKIKSISFDNETEKVIVSFSSLYGDTLYIPYKMFDDKENGLINFVIKKFGLKKTDKKISDAYKRTILTQL